MVTKTNTTNRYSRVVYTITQFSWQSPLSTSQSVMASSSVFTDTRTGVALPKWRSVIKSGGNATTAMSGEKFRSLAEQPIRGAVGRLAYGPNPGEFYSINENYEGYLPQFIAVFPHKFGTDVNKADSAAIISALRGVRQQRTQFQGLVFLGELSETIHQLRHPFQSARKLIDGYFKHLRASKAYKGAVSRDRRTSGTAKARANEFLTVAADTWLEVAFGLRPLISDVKDAAEAIARSQNDSRRAVVVGYGEDVVGSNTTTNNPVVNHLWTFDTTKDITTQSVRYKVAMDYTRSTAFGSNDRLRELNGLTLEQFVPTVWELVPWSFLVDYFSNIGDVISAGCTSQDEVKFVVRTERLTTIRQFNSVVGLPIFGGADGFWVNNGQAGQAILSRSTVSRSSSGSLPIPSFQFSLPGRASQWENMVALWKSNERSLLSRFRR